MKYNPNLHSQLWLCPPLNHLHKPAPDSVNQALKLLGAEKSEAIYVGDSEVDRATAENAGLDCISCSWGFRERSLLESLKPMAIIDKPEELLKFVQE